MKMFSKLLLIMLITTPLTGFSDARFAGFGFQKLSQQLCAAAQLKSPAKLRSTLMDAKMHLSEVYVYVDCDGESLLQIAELYQSLRVAEYLKQKVQGLSSNPRLEPLAQQ